MVSWGQQRHGHYQRSDTTDTTGGWCLFGGRASVSDPRVLHPKVSLALFGMSREQIYPVKPFLHNPDINGEGGTKSVDWVLFPVPLCNSYHSVPQLPWPTKPTNHVASKALSNTVAFSPTLWLVGSADANPPVQSPSTTNARGAWKCKAFCHQRPKDEKMRFFSRQRLERLWPIWMSTKMTKTNHWFNRSL